MKKEFDKIQDEINELQRQMDMILFKQNMLVNAIQLMKTVGMYNRRKDHE